MLTVLSVVGTRPEAIKMVPVIRELARHGATIRSLVCASAQHRELLDQVFDLFEIKSDYDLGVMQTNQTLSGLTSRLLSSLDPLVRETRPDWIIAQGDTTTVLASALVSYYHQLRFGHVEAGLRTDDKYRPFPEEMNRRMADQAADLLFPPTEGARQALLREGHPDARIVVTGNTVIDALLAVADLPYDWEHGVLSPLRDKPRLVLITCHRRESFGGPFQEICSAIKDLAGTFEADGVHFVYPVHLNPNIRGPVQGVLSGLPNLTLASPLDYFSLVHLMKRSELILTDSGGIQEEAPSLGVPVLVMRDTTERPEGVTAGVAKLVGTRRAAIVENASHLLRDSRSRAAMTRKVNPYGDGKAAQRIVSALLNQPESLTR
jgi:UDP-N-acetylglucosamine 2-epimerase